MVAPNAIPGDLTIVTDVAVEPITLVQAWYQCRLDPEGSPLAHVDDTFLTSIAIPAVRDYAERFTGLTLAPKVYQLTLDAFAEQIFLPVPPLVSVDSIKYDSEASGELTLASSVYVEEVSANEPSHIRLAVDESWPVTDGTAGAVRIEFTAGYTSGALPPAIRQGMLLMLAHIYKNREALTDRESFIMPLGVESFLRPYRVRLGMA